MSSTRMSTSKFFTKRLGVKFAVPILIVMLFIPTTLSTLDAYGQVQTQDCFAPLTTILDATYAGPVVVDSYWVDQGTSSASDVTSNPVKKEIGPGEGPSVFAVVFNNRNSAFPITSVTAFLNLPSGFSPTGESANPQLLQHFNQAARVANNPAVGNYYGTVATGASFTMYFNINVLPTAKVGTFATTVVANYIQVGVIGQQCTSALLNVPFVLPGKVVLDASTDTSDLTPQTKNNISITIENKGSADATGVVATIVNLGSSKGGTGSSGSGGSLVLQSATTQIVNLGPNTFNLGTIPAKAKVVISTTVYPSTATAGTTQEVQLQINYQNAWGKLSTDSVSTGLVIEPNPPQSLSLSYLGNTSTPVITAAALDDLDFAIANNSTNPMSNVLISLVPQSTSVSIVGPSTWTIPDLEPGDRQILTTKVYAANTLINSPTSFTLTANYISKGQAQTNSLTLGTFVVGNIKLQIYGLTTSSASGISNLVGNLLNQGSTTALFTTVQLAPSQLTSTMKTARLANSTNNQSQSFTPSAQGASGQGFQGGQGGGGQGRTGQGFQGGGGQRGLSSAPQFIGDLSPDSPIPISVPLRLTSLPSGAYQVAFKVVYADDLKNFHTVILNGTVFVAKSAPSTAPQSTSILDQIPLPVLIGIPIVIAGVIALVIKKKRSAKKKLKLLTQGDTDIVSIFDGDKKKENES
ncbi:MAG: COG1361 S-layer family protein [Nitrosotalea sp.]